MKFTSIGIFGLALSGLAFLGAAGCSSKSGGAAGGKDGKEGKESPPVPVSVALPQQKALRWSLEQPGSIQPFEQAALMAKLPGFVKKVHVEIQDRVKGPSADGKTPGTLLMELDIPEILEEANQKEAMAAQTRVEVELARKNLLVAEANVKATQTMVQEAKAGEKRARANLERWTSESVRVDDLVARKVIDKQSAEEIRNQAQSAESMLEETKAHILAAEAASVESQLKKDRAAVDIQVAMARQNAAEAEARRLVALKEYTAIHAPFDGIVTARNVHPGSFLQPNSNTREALMVSRIDPVRVVVDVPESSAAKIQVGDKVTVRIQVLRGAEFTGKVARTSWALHPESRTMRLEIDLPNPDARIRPGMYAFVTIPMEVPKVLVAPLAALVHQDDMSFCYIVEDGKAMRYQVQIGQADAESVELIRRKRVGPKQTWTAWTGEESIITTYQGALSDKQSVEIIAPK